MNNGADNGNQLSDEEIAEHDTDVSSIVVGHWRVQRQKQQLQLVGDVISEIAGRPFLDVDFDKIDQMFHRVDGGNLSEWLDRPGNFNCAVRPCAYPEIEIEIRQDSDALVSGGELTGTLLRNISRTYSIDMATAVESEGPSALASLAPQILQTLPDPVFVYELDRGWVFANPMARDLLTKPPELQDGVLELEMPKGFRRMMMHMHERVTASGRVSRIEFYAKHQRHGLRWWSGLWAPLADENGALRGIFVLHRDVTEKTEMQGELLRDRKKLQLLATTDPLTRLSNRRSFLQSLDDLAMTEAKKRGELSIVLLDVDHFKAVNDTYGHAAGDQVLKEIARVVRQQLRPHDLLARWGGEEFIICLPATAQDAALIIAERVRLAIESTCIAHDDIELSVTASFGLAIDDAKQLGSRTAQERLINDADAALYEAKRHGRNRVTCLAESVC